MAQLAFDEDTAPRLEAAYRTRDVIRRRGLVREALAVQAGQESSTSAAGSAST